jgi:hypothetical protein
MTLERGIGAAIEQRNGDVLFPMNDGLGLVPCRVTAEALYDLTGGRYHTPTSGFESVRLQIEMVASAKYDAGIVDEYGCVTVSPADFSYETQ